MESLNWLAIAAAGLAFFALGAIWYSPLLFVKTWMKENGFNADGPKDGMGRILGLALLFSLVASFILALLFTGHYTGPSQGAGLGFHAGLGFGAMSWFIIGLFEKRSLKLMLINGGYLVAGFTVMGLIIGAWS